MNTIAIPTGPAAQRIEFFRLPAPGKRDPYFGLSRGWYYKAAAAGEIKLVAIRHRGSLRGVRLIVYDSVVAYIHRSMSPTTFAASSVSMSPNIASQQLTLLATEAHGISAC